MGDGCGYRLRADTLNDVVEGNSLRGRCGSVGVPGDGEVGGRLLTGRSDSGFEVVLVRATGNVLQLDGLPGRQGRRRLVLVRDRVLGSRDVQARREAAGRASVFRAPSSHRVAAEEGRVPDDVDVVGVDTNDGSLHAERHSVRSRLLNHDNSISESERLPGKSVLGVSRLEDGLSRSTLDGRGLDDRLATLLGESVGETLQLLDGILRRRRQEQQAESDSHRGTERHGTKG